MIVTPFGSLSSLYLITRTETIDIDGTAIESETMKSCLNPKCNRKTESNVERKRGSIKLVIDILIEGFRYFITDSVFISMPNKKIIKKRESEESACNSVLFCIKLKTKGPTSKPAIR